MSVGQKCNCCKHLKVINRGFNTRGDCYCEHPNQEYIRDFYKKHKFIELETLHGHEDYEIIAAFTTPVYTGNDFEYYKFDTTLDPAEFNNYVRQCKEKSIYATGKSAEYGQRLLTLSTCEYTLDNGRFVVVAKRIS